MIERARQRRTIYYSQLAAEMEAIKLEPHDPRLFHFLGEIARAEDEAGRGLLTAVVVHKQDGSPGLGFYELAKSRGRDISDKDFCWTNALNEVYDFWEKQPGP